MSETFTLYKLIILYMLHRVDFPLTTSQISEFILEREYTNFFTLQQALSEAVDAHLIEVKSTYNKTLYHLTEDGLETIQFFNNQISPEIKEEIEGYLKEKKYELKNETSIKADYYLNTNHEFSVELRVSENQNILLDLMLTVPDETTAKTIAAHFTERNQEIYALLMQHLL